MLARINGQAAVCAQRAETCRKLADDPTYDALSRWDFQDMEVRWRALAESFNTAEQISGFLQWQAQRIEPPPGCESVLDFLDGTVPSSFYSS